jgi:1-deoxy-D-xylulose-5-phosphate reductoisomerase
MKKIGILGSTGSIGTQALEVISRQENKYSIEYLSTNINVEILAEQVKKYAPKIICVVDETKREYLQTLLQNIDVEILSGREGLLELASFSEVDISLNALVGSAGMEPTIKAIESKVDIALSNKESMVMAGEYITQLAKQNGVEIYPVDSEHSAIWQCLQGEKISQVNKLILTGSGGPFRKLDIDKFSFVTKADALNHPNWDMGAKITIDSATMMNKGLEVIEARWLFDISADNIEIVIHPQSIIHSMVEFADGSVKAQLGLPDMKIPIQYALTYPNHANIKWESLNLAEIGKLTFEAPDLQKFPSIRLAFDALAEGNSFPVILNVANDLVVQAFLEDKIHFTEIPKIIEQAIEKHPVIKSPTILDIKELSNWTQNFIKTYI